MYSYFANYQNTRNHPLPPLLLLKPKPCHHRIMVGIVPFEYFAGRGIQSLRMQNMVYPEKDAPIFLLPFLPLQSSF